MFREMRRKKQQLPEAESIRLLEEGTSGVLALAGDGGYPYAVPVSYVYRDGKIYFHGAKEGHKTDAVRSCDRASFCVIGQDCVLPEKYTSAYRSVIVFGRIRILEEEAEKREAILRLAERYYPEDREENRREAIRKAWERMDLMELQIERITGKEGLELRKKREAGNLRRNGGETEA